MTSQARPTSLPFARMATSALFFGNGFGIGTWAAQLPRFKASLGASDSGLSLALLAFALGAVLLMPTMGWLSGRFGSRIMALTSAFGFTLALILPGLAPNLALFSLAALIAGACNGALDVSMNTNASMVERAWHTPIMSSFHAFYSLGGLAGAGVSGVLIAANFDILPTLLISSTAIGILVVIACFGVMPDKSRHADGHGFAWPRGSMLGLAVLALLCFLIEGAMVDWSAIYLQYVANAPDEVASAGFAAFSLTMTICRFLGDFVVHHLGRTKTLIVGAGLAGLGLALVTAYPHPLLSILGFALIGLGLANVVPVLFSAASRSRDIPPGMGVAMVATLGYAGLLMGPPLIGFSGDLIGLRATLALLILFTLAVILLAKRVLRAFD